MKSCRSADKAFVEFLETERKQPDNDAVANTELRRCCYGKATTFFHGMNWYPQDDPTQIKHVSLPSCIVWAIRRKYEDKDGKYSGYPPKSALLQKVTDAHDKFTDGMRVYESIVDMANPKGGLLTTLQKLNQNMPDKMYGEMQQHGGPTSSASDNAGRWTESFDKGILVLPRLGLVSCATAFEASVQDAIKRCLDVLILTRNVSTVDEKCWISEFKKWSKSRANQSPFWPDEVHESEIRFWTDFISELRTRVDHSATHSKYMLETLYCFSKRVFQQLTRDPASQSAVGLVQEMVDAKKQEIMGKLQCPTFSYIQQTFCDIAASMEAQHRKARHRGGSRSRDWRGSYGEREPIMGVWGLCPQRGPGAEPLVRGSGGEAPLKLNAFWCCHMSEMTLNCYVYELFYGH